MYSQATCQYLQSKEQQLCWGLIFCLVIVATRSVCPHRTQGLQAEPLLFFRVWILLPFSAISLTFIFSTYNEMYFSTGLFFNRLYCSSPHANFFLDTIIHIHTSSTKWCCRKRNLGTETKVYQKSPNRRVINRINSELQGTDFSHTVWKELFL